MSSSAGVTLLTSPQLLSLPYTGDAPIDDELFDLIFLGTHLTDEETEAQNLLQILCGRSRISA